MLNHLPAELFWSEYEYVFVFYKFLHTAIASVVETHQYES